VTFSNWGKRDKNPEMSRVRGQLPSNVIGLRWTKQLDKEISLTSLLTKAARAPVVRFEVNYQLEDFCVHNYSLQGEERKNCGDLRNSDSTFSPAFVASRLVDREGH